MEEKQILLALAAYLLNKKLNELGRAHGKFLKKVGGIDLKKGKILLLEIIKEACDILISQAQEEK